MSAWTPVETGVQQICYLLAEVQKPGTNQAQVRLTPFRAIARPGPTAAAPRATARSCRLRSGCARGRHLA